MENTTISNPADSHRKNKWLTLNRFYNEAVGSEEELKAYDAEKSQIEVSKELENFLKSELESQKNQSKEKYSKEAIKMKEIGNKYLKKGELKKSIDFYSKAISFDYTNFYLWTNRALAYIKSDEIEKAVVDCTVVIELIEIEYEALGELSENLKDPYSKALLRRAKALKMIKQFDKALKDIGKCVDILGEDDESLVELKKEVEGEKGEEEENIVEEVKKDDSGHHDHDKEHEHEHEHHDNCGHAALDEDSKKFLDEFFILVSEKKIDFLNYDYFKLTKILDKRDKKILKYFMDKGGLKVTAKILKEGEFKLLNEDPGKIKLQFLNYFHIVMANNLVFMNKLNEEGVITFLMNEILKNLFNLEKSQTGKNKEILELKIEEFTELLILFSSNNSSGKFMASNSHIFLKIFDLAFLHFPNFQKNYSFISSILTLISNLFIFNSTPDAPNTILTYISDNYLKNIFITFSLFLQPESTIYVNFKKSILAFMSNFLIAAKPRNFCVLSIMTSSSSDNTPEIDFEERSSSPPLFFFENLVKDGMKILDFSVEKHKKFGQNTRKYFDYFINIFMNLLHGNKNKRVIIAFLQVMNQKKITVFSLRLLNLFMKFENEKTTLMYLSTLGRIVSFFARFYTMRYIGKEKTLILENAKMLAKIFVRNQTNQAFCSEASMFFVAMLQMDLELKQDIFGVLKEEGYLVEFHKGVLLQGPDVDKVR